MKQIKDFLLKSWTLLVLGVFLTQSTWSSPVGCEEPNFRIPQIEGRVIYTLFNILSQEQKLGDCQIEVECKNQTHEDGSHQLNIELRIIQITGQITGQVTGKAEGRSVKKSNFQLAVYEKDTDYRQKLTLDEFGVRLEDKYTFGENLAKELYLSLSPEAEPDKVILKDFHFTDVGRTLGRRKYLDQKIHCTK